MLDSFKKTAIVGNKIKRLEKVNTYGDKMAGFMETEQVNRCCEVVDGSEGELLEV